MRRWLLGGLLAGFLLASPLPGRAGACPPGGGGTPAGAGGRLGLVFSGGGAKAAYEAGVALALHERGVVPAAVGGTSSGALNAVLVAAGESERLAGLWRTVRREDVFEYRGLTVLSGLLPGWLALPAWGASGSLLDPEPLRRTLARQVDLGRVRGSAVGLLVVAADLRSGGPRRFDNRSVSVEALLASLSLPGLFPPVALDGALLVDGGVVQRAPVLELLDAYPLDRLIVVSAYGGEAPGPETARILFERAFELALSREVARDVELARRRHPGVDVRLLTPSEPVRVRPLDFDGERLGRLVDLGRGDALRCLEALGATG